jgi:phosphonate transport system permease protein
VLGLIGAGGLGLIINEFVEQLAWDKASTVLIITIAMTLTIDYSSAYIRSQLL